MFALMLSASATAAPTAFGLATRGPGVPRRCRRFGIRAVSGRRVASEMSHADA